jgi:hypothetical protein
LSSSPKIDGTSVNETEVIQAFETTNSIKMSSWKEKLANKTTTAVTKDASPAAAPAGTGPGGWKQRINEKHTNPDQYKPVLPKVSIDDLNDFPALGGGSAPLPQQKQPALTGFAALAREWSTHAKEEKEREEREKMHREQQEYAYNYNISKLSAINNRLMAFNAVTQVRYDDEYNADYEKDLHYHNDT